MNHSQPLLVVDTAEPIGRQVASARRGRSTTVPARVGPVSTARAMQPVLA